MISSKDLTSSEHVLVEDDLRTLLAKDRQIRNSNVPSLIIWRNALKIERLLDLMDPTWHKKLINGLRDLTKTQWEAQSSTYGEIKDIDWLRVALDELFNEEGNPQQNFSAELSFREYTDLSDYVGGIDWWNDLLNGAEITDELTKEFVYTILDLLHRLDEQGMRCFVEKIAVVSAKDPNSNVPTLTPTLHSDSFYAHRESVAFSVAEPGWSNGVGTLYVPSARMDDIWEERPIDMKKLETLFDPDQIIGLANGDVSIYDGMRDDAMVEHRNLGVPHISPDLAGQSSRQLVLIRHIKDR